MATLNLLKGKTTVLASTVKGQHVGMLMADKSKGSVQMRFEILEYLFFSGKNQLRTHVCCKATDASYEDFLKHLSYLKEKQLNLPHEGHRHE